jgi:hypothetical protein
MVLSPPPLKKREKRTRTRKSDLGFPRNRVVKVLEVPEASEERVLKRAPPKCGLIMLEK